MNKTYIAYYNYSYSEDHPLYKEYKSQIFQHVKVVQAESPEEARKLVGIHLYEICEEENILITGNIDLEETEIIIKQSEKQC